MIDEGATHLPRLGEELLVARGRDDDDGGLSTPRDPLRPPREGRLDDGAELVLGFVQCPHGRYSIWIDI